MQARINTYEHCLNIVRSPVTLRQKKRESELSLKYNPRKETTR